MGLWVTVQGIGCTAEIGFYLSNKFKKVASAQLGKHVACQMQEEKADCNQIVQNKRS